MNCVIPYTKELTFKTKIAEITSISLEHEMNINAGELLGNFIVSGEYKTHEVSINKEDFSYTLPFSIDLSDNVDLDTVEFSITDFTYEIANENTLKVFIEFRVVASEKQEIIEDVRDNLFESVPDTYKEEIITSENNLIEESPSLLKEIKESDDEKQIVLEDNLKRNDEQNEKTIIDSIEDNEEYATYHIHMVKEGEVIENISKEYNCSIDLINEYNDLSNITIGDKLIIPEEINE